MKGRAGEDGRVRRSGRTCSHGSARPTSGVFYYGLKPVFGSSSITGPANLKSTRRIERANPAHSTSSGVAYGRHGKICFRDITGQTRSDAGTSVAPLIARPRPLRVSCADTTRASGKAGRHSSGARRRSRAFLRHAGSPGRERESARPRPPDRLIPRLRRLRPHRRGGLVPRAFIRAPRTAHGHPAAPARVRRHQRGSCAGPQSVAVLGARPFPTIVQDSSSSLSPWRRSCLQDRIFATPPARS